jgi:hypothetical protein
MSRLFVVGGVVASVVLIVFGIGSIAAGAIGRSDVSNKLEQEGITGSYDMTPEPIAKGARAAGLTNVELPTCSVAGEAIHTGSEAKCFAEYMRIHALEATGGNIGFLALTLGVLRRTGAGEREVPQPAPAHSGA